MSHSCFAASAFVQKLLAFVITLHRLEFPANVRVHIQVSVFVEFPALFLLRLRFYGNNVHELPTAYLNFSKNCREYSANKFNRQHKNFQ